LGITARTWYGWLFWSAAFTAFLTAFYTFRAALLTFFGPERVPPEAGHHAHESPPSMTLPLQILSVGAVVLGLALGHLTGLFDGYLDAAIPGTGAHHPADLFVMGLSTLAAILGIGLAWICYGQPTTLAAALANAVPPARRLSENKFYFDEIYFVALVLPLRCIAQLCRFIDWMIVDGLVGAVSALPRTMGQFLRPLQNGLVQFYALAMMLALALLAWGLLLGPNIRG
jgi:NADH-quinone oxidoreductase subunit L